MAVDLTYILTLKDAGDKTFVMPSGFDANVEIYCWGAGGGGSLGVSGGGGGYASTVAQIPIGSVVRLQIGQPGADGGRGTNPPSAGGSHPSYTRYRGGSAGSSYDEDGDTGSGGGGGGASAVVVNDSPVCVGAGGGGAGGPGNDSGSGSPGNPGGVYPDGLTATTDGGDSANAWTSGGGGGGGYYGGLGGTSYGDDSGNAPGGNGGQNYGAVTETGSGTLPGGRTTTYYPTTLPNIGHAGYPGYIVMKFTRKPGLQIKNPDGSGNWVTVNNTYVKINGPTPASLTFSKIGSSTFKVPDGVSIVNLTYLTSSGLVTAVVPVRSGGIIPVTVGDVGQASSFGDFSIPAVNQQVFRYIGNVDHLLNADVQIATPTGQGITSSGYNAQNTSDAASVGITYNVTYEGWHGDLYATLYFNPVATDKIFGKFQIVGSGGGRAGGPSITTQPTVANGYIMGIQMFDPYGGEGGYDTYYTLQQSGYMTVDYTSPTLVDAWRNVQQIYVKNGNVWKPISQQNAITLYNYK
jgi:hypothetical protein